MKLILSFIFLLQCSLCAAQNTLPLWNFDSLDFKGGYNKFERAPSSSKIYLTDSVYHGAGGKSLQVIACKQTEGYCGAWINFFFTKRNQVRYIHAAEFNYISFYIKGDQGGEQVQIQLSDKNLSEREDSRPAKPLSNYLPQGITTAWQQVLIPLKDLERFDPSQLAGLTFNFTSTGCYEIFVDDICLKKTANDPTPLTTQPNIQRLNKELQNAMWVWQTNKLFNNLAYREKFFDYCKRLNIQHVYLQLFYDDNLTTLLFADSLKALTSSCYDKGIKIYGLDGSPEWGLYEKHEVPLSIVNLIAQYNTSASVKEKLAGAHFDIEPYLLLGFNDPSLKKQIIYENLDLKKKLAELCRQKNLILGLDIPFWYEDQDSSGLAATHTLFNNKEQAASYHMIDMAQHIDIMGYRNFTYGSDGMINKDLNEIIYASGIPGKSIWAGVETITETPGGYALFTCFGKDELSDFLKQNEKVISRSSRYKGFRLMLFEYNGYVFMGIEQPQKAKRKISKQNKNAIVEFKKLLAQWPVKANKEFMAVALDDYLNRNSSEWRVIKKKEDNGISTVQVIYQPSETNTKLSFQGKSLQRMLEEVYTAAPVFLAYPSFKGFAFHCFESLLLLPSE